MVYPLGGTEVTMSGSIRGSIVLRRVARRPFLKQRVSDRAVTVAILMDNGIGESDRTGKVRIGAISRIIGKPRRQKLVQFEDEGNASEPTHRSWSAEWKTPAGTLRYEEGWYFHLPGQRVSAPYLILGKLEEPVAG